ncbi:uncharacterized protein LTR77_001321 [Saxophila tyrrhenica]|uniref:Uncharacterized protein n=1 Tax=Saxophila tyrrhenica TaxID=1690608 RepID=A0AAV9PKG9_9PEZI|nr:hypothetical protein LTR77_001321 [Saxophila tyrrhenica]
MGCSRILYTCLKHALRDDNIIDLHATPAAYELSTDIFILNPPTTSGLELIIGSTTAAASGDLNHSLRDYLHLINPDLHSPTTTRDDVFLDPATHAGELFYALLDQQQFDPCLPGFVLYAMPREQLIGSGVPRFLFDAMP